MVKPILCFADKLSGKNGFNSGLPVSSVLEKDKIHKEIKNRYGAQSRP
jgi:hypothetical protein